jgi:hypothetical protein
MILIKKTISTLAIATLLASTVLTSCNSSSEKVEDAKTDVADAKTDMADANKDLAVAKEEYLADVEKYRYETAERIAANDRSIAEFKIRVNSEKKAARADYEKKIAELEQKNSDMKSRMDGYNADGKEKWEAFKTEFSHDMDELGKAFNDLTVKNVKTKN